ncbi:MAG: MFS transporter [Chloroflexota bacterium]
MTDIPLPSAAAGGLWSPGRRALTIGLVTTITLVAFEALAVSTVMPIVAAELHGLDLYGWVFSAFFLGNLIGIVVVGGAIDRGGLVRPLAAGLALFSVGLVVGGLAPSMSVLVVGRFLQGLGAGAIAPVAYVAIGRSLPEALRPRMFATLSTAWVLPGLIGPAIAGAIAQLLDWRVVFLGLLPIILAAGVLTLPAIAPYSQDPETAASAPVDHRRRLGWGLLLALGAGLTVVGLTRQLAVPGLPVEVVGLAAMLMAFTRLTPAGTLRLAPGLPAAVGLRGVLTFAFFCSDAFVPLALQEWRGLSAAVAGLALTAATLSWTGGAWLQARRINRYGAPPFVRLGFATVIVGIGIFATVLVPTVPIALGVAGFALAGLGMGFAYSPLSLTILREAPPATVGAATSGLQLSDVLGTALGTGIGGAVIAAGSGSGWSLGSSLGVVFAIGMSAAVLGLLGVGRLRWSHRRDTSPAPSGA